MKRFLRTISCAAAAAVLFVFALSAAGCASSGGKTVLRVYNWEDYISQPDGSSDEYVDLIAKFEEENPGVTVEYSTFGTNENMYNELKINAAGYDLVCPSDYMIMKMIDEDMVEPFTDDFLANSNYAKYASPYIKDLFEQNEWTRYAAAYMWGTMGYVYNPELVSAEDLSSWAGIWSGKYDHMSTIKDSVRDSYFLGVAYVYREELAALAKEYGAGNMTLSDEKYAEYNEKVTAIMNRTDEDTLEKVKSALLDLKQYLYGFEVDSGKQDMITGKISINFAWSGDAVFAMDDAEPYTDENGREIPGIYLNYIVPDECSNIWFDGWVMPKGANVELAQKFIDFLSRPENAVANMNFIGYTSAVAGDEVYEEMIDWYDESAEGTPGFDEDGNALVPYDLNYFFGGTGNYDDYVIYVSEDSLNRQISAQYPTEQVIVRSAVMQHFDNETTAAVNEMWEEVKGLPIPVWAYIVIAVIIALILVAALSYIYKGKRREPKPKKGYRILKKGA